MQLNSSVFIATVLIGVTFILVLLSVFGKKSSIYFFISAIILFMIILALKVYPNFNNVLFAAIEFGLFLTAIGVFRVYGPGRKSLSI